MRWLLLSLLLAGCQVPVSPRPELMPFVASDGGINIPTVTFWIFRF